MSYMCLMFSSSVLEPYGMTNWLFSYEYGFAKRALFGSIFRILAGHDLSFEEFKSWIKVFHYAAIFIFFILIITVFNLTDRSNFSFVWFVVLLTSMFSRNIFLLAGYLDIWIANLILLALILYLSNHNILYLFVLVLSGFVHELIIFFIPAISVFYLYNRVNKSWIVYIFCSLLACLIITYISLYFFDRDTLINLLSTYPELFSHDQVEYVANILLNHYSIIELISERFSIIIQFYKNEIFAFIFYCFTTIFLLVVTLRNLKNEISRIYKSVLFLAAIFPCFLTFIATDLWRIASFYNFSSFIIFICCNNKAMLNERVNFVRGSSKFLLTILLIVQCSMPYIYFSRENVGFSNTNSCRYNYYVKDTIFYDLAKLIVFNYTYSDEYKSYTKEGPYDCSNKGNKSVSLVLYPGLNQIKIHSVMDKTLNHYIAIKSQPFYVENSEFEFSIYQSMESALSGASTLYCLPGNEDWKIEKIEVQLIE